MLSQVDLAVTPGEFLVLLGPNGSGKTTLLRAILGLVKPDQGRVVTPFFHAKPGYVPQHGGIDPMFPVSTEYIVAMGLYPRLGPWGRYGRGPRNKVRAALEHLGLAGEEHKSFDQLSGGMRQKALIARALVGDPEVIILDEPTSGLDEQSQKEVMHILASLSRQQGQTVLMAHHGEHLLAGHVEQCAQLAGGRLTRRRLQSV